MQTIDNHGNPGPLKAFDQNEFRNALEDPDVAAVSIVKKINDVFALGGKKYFYDSHGTIHKAE